MHSIYLCLSYVFHVFAEIFLKIRIYKKTKDPARYKKKLGIYKLKNQTTTGIKEVPIASIMNPFGTVLYGSKSSVSLDQRLHLEIYYTKPD